MKVPLESHPDDIEQKSKDMILEFISNENCLILTVTQTNIDSVNSDVFRLTREVNEKGERTIAVITKLDLMDNGTDALEIALKTSKKMVTNRLLIDSLIFFKM